MASAIQGWSMAPALHMEPPSYTYFVAEAKCAQKIPSWEFALTAADIPPYPYKEQCCSDNSVLCSLKRKEPWRHKKRRVLSARTRSNRKLESEIFNSSYMERETTMRRSRKCGGAMILAISLGIAFGLSGCETIKKVGDKSKANFCRENLVRIDNAKKKWAEANNKTSGPGPSLEELVGSTPHLQKKPRCQARGTYSVNPIGDAPTCSAEGHVIR